MRARSLAIRVAAGACALAATLAIVASAPANTMRSARASGGIAVGAAAPPFVLARPGGGEITLAAFRRRPLVVNVFASWCASCRAEAGVLIRAYRRYGAGVAFLGVDEQEGESVAVAFAKKAGLPYSIALDDGQFSATYGTSKIPETVFVDSRGVVRAIRLGQMNERAFQSAIATIASST